VHFHTLRCRRIKLDTRAVKAECLERERVGDIHHGGFNREWRMQILFRVRTRVSNG
jgi:hypothetical protein